MPGGTGINILSILPVRTQPSALSKYSAIRSPYDGMTQTSSAIIVTIEPSMEYAKLCMSIRSGNARYSADPGLLT
jgi:hypothetical protein